MLLVAFGEVLRWELLMESIPAIAGCLAHACSFLGHLMLLPAVAVIFLKQRDSEDQITLDSPPPHFKIDLMNMEQLLDESVSWRVAAGCQAPLSPSGPPPQLGAGVFGGGGKVHGRGGNVSQQPPVRTELLPR